MCARLLACPLCSQPRFQTLDSLRNGLVSVSTRPLVCPVCNEVLLGIDKLTIHLFGHTINQNNNTNLSQESKILNVDIGNNLQILHNVQTIPLQTWNLLKTQNAKILQSEEAQKKIFSIRHERKHYYPPKEENILLNSQFSGEDQNKKVDNHVTSRQNVSPDQIYSANFEQNEVRSGNRCKLNLSCGLYSIQENVDSQPQKSQERQIKTSKSNSIQNTSTVVHNDSNLIQNNLVLPKISVLVHENDKSSSNLQIKSMQSSWIQNNTSSIINQRDLMNKEAFANSESNHISNSSTKSSYMDSSYQVEPCRLTNSKNEGEIHSQGNETEFTEYQMKSEAVENRKETRDENLPQFKSLKMLASKDKMERCNICGYRFDDRKILILHKQLVHMIAEKDFNVKPEDLLKNYPCHLCSKVFKMRGSLMVHMRVAHTGCNLGPTSKGSNIPNNENGFNCPTCGKNFKKEQHVTQHLKTHEGKQWECDICSKMFKTKYFLKKHKRLHSGEMPYKCNICEKTFTFQQSYHKHRLYHRDDKPHTCNTCGRSFKELSTLHNHERIHTGEKPFACETCGKCFRQRVSYLVHQRIHTGVMPYKCTVCGKSFRYKVSQRTHKCQTSQNEVSNQSADTIIKKLMQISEPEEKNNETCKVQTQEIDMNIIEGNKFILLVNAEGQHVLTRESDVKNAEPVNKESNIESTETQNSEEEEQNIWEHETNNKCSKESMDISTKDQVNNEKLHLDDSNDFFSMVMSPLKNDFITPSAEMEHLRLSSPIEKEDKSESADIFSQSCENLGIKIAHSNVEGEFEGHIRGTLRTIDDESLNELIYGINRE